MVRLKKCGYGLSFGKGLLNGLVWVQVEIGELEDQKNLGRVYWTDRGCLLIGLRNGEKLLEEGRQTVLETLHSKLLLVLHITQFPHYRVTNNNAGIFYCPKARLEHQRGKNLHITRLSNSRVIKVTRLYGDWVSK